MDPEACLIRAYNAANALGSDHGCEEESKEALADYREWRRKGGFEPHCGDLRASALEAWWMLQS